ncbi:MAG TPA: ABC transporter substrate-binding protein [Acidimicrobiales bacterium]
MITHTANRRLVAFLAVGALAAAACGTRLPDEAFLTTTAAGQDPIGVIEPGAPTGLDPATGEPVDPTQPGVDGTPSGSDLQGGSSSGGAGSSNGGGGGSTSGGSSGGGSTGGGGSSTGPTKANYASDQGVTATTIKVGNISAIEGPLGPETFSGPFHGARAFFLEQNAKGGIGGRQVQFITCDDQENPERNKACANTFVEDEKVFALVANATDAHASAEITDSARVPDIGSEPIGSEYYKWPTLYSILGAEGYSRDGTEYGEGGRIYVQTGQYRWQKNTNGITKAAVIFYAAPQIAKQAGDFTIAALEAEGIEVVYTPNNGAGRNPADPNFDQDVLGAVNAGAQAIWQAIDIAGFQRLCQSVDRLRATVADGGPIKVVAGQANVMGDVVGQRFSFPCRDHVYSNSESWPFSEQHPEAAAFRAAMARHDPDWILSQWTFEGWIAAKLFTEAVAAQGADLTREGVIEWLDAQRRWQGGGVMAGMDWRREQVPREPTRECIAISKWDESAGQWKQQFAPFHCDNTPWVFYTN